MSYTMSNDELVKSIEAAQMEMQKQLLERDAVIEQMREFVEAAINIGNEFGCLDLNYAEDYLALTPSECLANHDAEVAAKALEDAAAWFEKDWKMENYMSDELERRAKELRRNV